MKHAYDDLEYGENRIEGLKVTIVEDSDPESPREWDNVGTMVCWHRNYTLGDEQPSEDPSQYLSGLVADEMDDTDLDYDEDEELYVERAQALLQEKYVILPLFLYDHSGISMSTSTGYPYNDPWDAGQVGYIYASKAKLKEEGVEDGEAALRGEVETYDQYLRGEVYGYTVEDENDEVLDSCWGFFGVDFVKQEAINSVNWWIEDRRKERIEHVKTMIRNHVPLNVR